MAVIAATLTKEFRIVTEKLKHGFTCSQIIEELRAESMLVRFEDNGYSPEWKTEAKARGLYVNEEFIEILERMKEECQVFVEVGACNESEIRARCECAKESYILTVETEAKALVHTATQSVVPRAYAYFNTLSSKTGFPSINRFSSKFSQCLDEALRSLEELEEETENCETLI